MAQPWANSHLPNPHSIPGSAGKAASLHHYVILPDRDQKPKEGAELTTVPLEDTHLPPWSWNPESH